MICRHCQDYIPNDSRFCPKCGIRLWIPPPANRPWRWIVVIFLVAVIWSRVVGKELKVQLQDQILNLRAQANRALNTL